MIKRTVHIKSVEVFSGPCLLPSAMSSVFALATSADLIINQNKPPSGHLCVYCRANYFQSKTPKHSLKAFLWSKNILQNAHQFQSLKGFGQNHFRECRGCFFWYIVTCFVKMIQSEMEEAQPQKLLTLFSLFFWASGQRSGSGRLSELECIPLKLLVLLQLQILEY